MVDQDMEARVEALLRAILVSRSWSAMYVVLFLPFLSFLSFYFLFIISPFFPQLPWSTANEDLVELFETTGQVELAEILFDGTRSKGCGVVQFSQTAEAETAIGLSSFFNHCSPSHADDSILPTAKFQQYMYGGRPLGACL